MVTINENAMTKIITMRILKCGRYIGTFEKTHLQNEM